MTESPGTAKQEQGKKHEKSFSAKLRDFVTSTAGLITGLATIVTATSTIIGVLWHSTGRPSSTVANTPTQGTNATPTTETTAPSPEKARIQWGPGSLLLTNNGTLLTSVPPGNNQQVVGDVYVGGGNIEPFSGTVLALWTNNGQPTAQQCWNLTTTQGTPMQGVNVVPGSVVCAATNEGPIAVINVISLNTQASTIETRTTIWDLPGS